MKRALFHTLASGIVLLCGGVLFAACLTSVDTTLWQEDGAASDSAAADLLISDGAARPEGPAAEGPVPDGSVPEGSVPDGADDSMGGDSTLDGGLAADSTADGGASPDTTADGASSPDTSVDTASVDATVDSSTLYCGGSSNCEVITTCEQLQRINHTRATLRGSYALANDIDCGATKPTDARNGGSVWDNGGLGFEPISNFSGSIYGNGHSVFALYINRPAEDRVGLIGEASAGAWVQDLRLVVDIVGASATGGLMGRAYHADIQACATSGSILGTTNVGGLVGESEGTDIVRSASRASARGTEGVGGLVGTFEGGNGGQSATMQDSYAVGQLEGGGTNFGGLVGVFAANSDPTVRIIRCYAAGAVAGTGGGGLIGLLSLAQASAVIDSYWDTDRSGQATSPAGVAMSSVEAVQSATYSGWDFTSIWKISAGVSYPCLVWETSCPQP